MSKIIVYVEGSKVTSYEVVEPNMIEAARRGLKGVDAVNYDRAVKALGADVMASATKSAALKSEDEALAEIATSRGKAFILTDRLPDHKDLSDLVVEGGKLSVKKSA